jgi:hypothetical protein
VEECNLNRIRLFDYLLDPNFQIITWCTSKHNWTNLTVTVSGNRNDSSSYIEQLNFQQLTIHKHNNWKIKFIQSKLSSIFMSLNALDSAKVNIKESISEQLQNNHPKFTQNESKYLYSLDLQSTNHYWKLLRYSKRYSN